MITKIVDNFNGSLTRVSTGKLNSGLAKYEKSWGYNPFTKPTDLTWFERPSIIGATLTSCLTSGKVNVEGSPASIVAFYGYGPDAKLVKYTVGGSGSPDLDVGSILTGTISGAAASFGGQMQFYGATEKIWVGHDTNILKINFDGSNANPSVATIQTSVISGTARPSAQFLGKLYFGNGQNLIEVDSTETVTSYAKLSPGFPSGTFIRDLNVTADGNYLQITVSRINAISVTQTLDGQSMGSVDSFIFYWNGTDTGYTSFQNYSGFGLTANLAFADLNYVIGTDLSGTAFYQNRNKVLTMPNLLPPMPDAIFTTGNMVGITSPEYDNAEAELMGSSLMYGQYDQETPQSLYRLFQLKSSVVSGAGRTDVLRVPLALPVTNLLFRADGANVSGTSKMYFSTVEWQSGGVGTIGYLYKFRIIPDNLQTSVVSGVWESQNEVFEKKVQPAEVRFYTEPLVADNSFKIEFVDVKSSVLGGQTFTAGTSPVLVNDERVRWNPNLSPNYLWGVRITNLGSKNWTGVKLEIDFVEAGR